MAVDFVLFDGKYPPKLFLYTVSGTDLSQCNYDYVYVQIIHHWQEIVSTTPYRSKTEILSQTIWNNKFITIDKKMVYVPHWH